MNREARGTTATPTTAGESIEKLLVRTTDDTSLLCCSSLRYHAGMVQPADTKRHRQSTYTAVCV